MSIGSVYIIGTEAIRAKLGAAAEATRDPDAMVAAAKGVDILLRRHFLKKNQQPNKRGWRRSGFWAGVAASVRSGRDGSGASVEVNDPRFLSHLRGARITPKRRRALAIPIHADAAGYSPSNYTRPDDIFRIKGRNLLAVRDGGGVKVMWALVSSATIPRDPDALPPDADVEAAAVRAAESWWRRRLRPGG